MGIDVLPGVGAFECIGLEFGYNDISNAFTDIDEYDCDVSFLKHTKSKPIFGDAISHCTYAPVNRDVKDFQQKMQVISPTSIIIGHIQLPFVPSPHSCPVVLFSSRPCHLRPRCLRFRIAMTLSSSL